MPKRAPDILRYELDSDKDVNIGSYRNKILAEGDSWFAWGELTSKKEYNLLTEMRFANDTIIVNYAYTGDLIRNMADVGSNLGFFFEFDAIKYDAILVSAGGNDLIDALAGENGFDRIIVPHGANPADQLGSYIDQAALRSLCNSVYRGYVRIVECRDSSQANAGTPLVLHTYDYPTARPAKAKALGKGVSGPWLIRALQLADVPEALWQDMTHTIYDALAKRIGDTTALPNVHVVKSPGTLEAALSGTDAYSNDWANEIHPNRAGYAKISRKIETVLSGLGIN